MPERDDSEISSQKDFEDLVNVITRSDIDAPLDSFTYNQSGLVEAARLANSCRVSSNNPPAVPRTKELLNHLSALCRYSTTMRRP